MSGRELKNTPPPAREIFDKTGAVRIAVPAYHGHGADPCYDDWRAAEPEGKPGASAVASSKCAPSIAKS